MGAAGRNEARKLLATWLNNLGTGIISVGVFTPTAALLLDVPSSSAVDVIVLVISGSAVVGALLHGMGKMALLGYEE